MVLIYVGAPGTGKSTIVRLLCPLSEETKAVLERVDTFTQASWSSHAANKSAKELDKIDLLPRIKAKTMLTKELSQLFSNEEKVLRSSFGTLTSVLDGNGLMSNSGSHGERSYEGDYRFNWSGATTPIPARTHDLMAQLGNRILFYEVPSRESTDEELLLILSENAIGTEVELLVGKANDVIEAHFRNNPVDSVDPHEIAFPDDLKRQLVRYAQLIASGRVAVSKNLQEGDYEASAREGVDYEASAREGVERVMFLLNMICLGFALIGQRREVTQEDLNFIKWVAFSSLPEHRRTLLNPLIAEGGELTSTQFEAAGAISKPTALRRMKELAATGLVQFTGGVQQSSSPAKVTLREKWRWLLASITGRTLKQIRVV